MQVSAIRPQIKGVQPVFTAKIIDSHTHLGHIFGRDYGIETLDKFVRTSIPTNVNGKKDFDTIEKVVISNGDAVGGTLGELEGNEKMLNLIRGRNEYLPLAVCQPAKTNGDISQIEQLFEKHPNKFVGLKFHPTIMPLANEAEYMSSYMPYMEFAQKNQIPCLFHCQGGQAGADKIFELAKKVPEVPVILGHSGSLAAEGYPNREAALRVFEESLTKKNANIYLDLSWVGWGADGLPLKNSTDLDHVLRIAQKHNGENKLLFGTDAPLGCFGENELAHCNSKQSYSNAVSYLKEQINNVFGKDAKKVSEKIFYDNSKEIYDNKTTKLLKTKQGKGALAALATVVVGLGIIGCLKNNNASVEDKLKKHNHKPKVQVA